jgi:hypothetical protein
MKHTSVEKGKEKRARKKDKELKAGGRTTRDLGRPGAGDCNVTSYALSSGHHNVI